MIKIETIYSTTFQIKDSSKIYIKKIFVIADCIDDAIYNAECAIKYLMNKNESYKLIDLHLELNSPLIIETENI